MKSNSGDLTDDELLFAARMGSEEAFAALVRRHEQRVAATVKGMLGDTTEAEDVGQETFVRLYYSLRNFRGESKLGTYLTRIAINLSINELRNRRRRDRFFSSPQEVSNEATEQMAAISEPQYETLEFREEVRGAISNLKPKLRAVVVLRLIDGYSTAETAGILRIPQGTVLSRLARAQVKLKELLLPYATDSKNKE